MHGDLLVRQKTEILRALEDYVPERYMISRIKDARVLGEFRLFEYYGNSMSVSIQDTKDRWEGWLSLVESLRGEIRSSTVSRDHYARFLLGMEIRGEIDLDSLHFRDVWWVRRVAYVWNERVLGKRTINVKRSIENFKTQMDKDALVRWAPSFFRTTERTALIRDELLGVYPRWRAILNCKALKEEIMMAAWHPRRVEHILTTYGWEAYDNLLGLE